MTPLSEVDCRYVALSGGDGYISIRGCVLQGRFLIELAVDLFLRPS